MGEYALYNGKRVKIGTCEQMYYLRADQADKVQWERGNVNPITDAGEIRFRFPFPEEDNEPPGGFDGYDYDKGMGVYGVEPPEDLEHSFLQFTRNYPQSGGIILSTPCPRSKEGKAANLGWQYNGYSGAVHIHSQRLVNGKLVLICRCGDCGALYRLPTLEDAQPVIDSLLKQAAADRRGCPGDDPARAKYYEEVARRILAGYTEPNLWTKRQSVAA